jgi:3'(2'), 5'-bisphosphate nucleotidase
VTKSAIEQLTGLAVEAAQHAGQLILQFYGRHVEVELKSDQSPLTIADKTSHEAIVAKLLSTGIPVVSEESDAPAVETHGCYWLVDPLDGTKDFLAGNDEFTVNIALMLNEEPVAGVVYGPATGELYAGIRGAGAWRQEKNARVPAVVIQEADDLRMATSRFHDHPDAHAFAELNGITQFVAVGSSLKYGRMAFGEIDVYPRLVGTSEWDTAAGQAILEAAGGRLLNWHNGLPMTYNKTNRRNGRFIALRAPYRYERFNYQVFKSEIS